MKKLVLSLCAGVAFLALSPAAAFADDVRVTLTGVDGARGGIILGTLQMENDFMQPRGSYNIAVPTPAAGGTVELVFANVAPGAYAFSAIQDENGDMQMQRQENGRPLEGWAMHNAASLRGRPTFAQVKVDVGAGGAALTEPMIYPSR